MRSWEIFSFENHTRDTEEYTSASSDLKSNVGFYAYNNNASSITLVLKDRQSVSFNVVMGRNRSCFIPISISEITTIPANTKIILMA